MNGYGTLNGHNVGMILKEIIRRVMIKVHQLRINPEVTQKLVAYKADPHDIVTAADFAAQEIYVNKLQENFPGYGIIAEEKNLIIPCTLEGHDAFFTIDGVDGTKALERQQSHGVGTMLSLTLDGDIVSAFVGDIMTGELFYYRPGSNKVHRLNHRDERYVELGTFRDIKLEDQYMLLRNSPSDVDENIGDFIDEFKNIEVSGGSIGLWLSRLWKGEVGAAILDGTANTPWDANPIYGISKKLGFVFLGFDLDTEWWTVERDIRPLKQNNPWGTETLVIHTSKLAELAEMKPPVLEEKCAD